MRVTSMGHDRTGGIGHRIVLQPQTNRGRHPNFNRLAADLAEGPALEAVSSRSMSLRIRGQIIAKFYARQFDDGRNVRPVFRLFSTMSTTFLLAYIENKIPGGYHFFPQLGTLTA